MYYLFNLTAPRYTIYGAPILECDLPNFLLGLGFSDPPFKGLLFIREYDGEKIRSEASLQNPQKGIFRRAPDAPHMVYAFALRDTTCGVLWRGTDDRYFRKLFKFYFLITQAIVNKLTAHAHPKNLLTTYAHTIKIAQDRFKLFHFIF